MRQNVRIIIVNIIISDVIRAMTRDGRACNNAGWHLMCACARNTLSQRVSHRTLVDASLRTTTGKQTSDLQLQAERPA